MVSIVKLQRWHRCSLLFEPVSDYLVKKNSDIADDVKFFEQYKTATKEQVRTYGDGKGDAPKKDYL